MKKISRMNEIGWVLGILLCTLGIAFCTKSNFGLSMIAAPAYIIHVKMVQFFPFYTQGTSEYVFQITLILITFCITRKFKLKYILSFVTAILSGFALDFWLFLLGGNGAYDELWLRIAAFIISEILTALAIAFFFRTTLPVQGYELLVAEIAHTFKLKTDTVKLFNDIIYFAASVILALVLNGSFQGIGIGTIVITIVNAPIIAFFGRLLDKYFTFN